MKGLNLLFVSLGACLAATADSGTQYTTTYQSYNPADRQFDLTQNILYELPDPTQFGPGPYPVFIWVPGTYEPYNLNYSRVSALAATGAWAFDFPPMMFSGDS